MNIKMNGAENIKHDWCACRSVNDAYKMSRVLTTE